MASNAEVFPFDDIIMQQNVQKIGALHVTLDANVICALDSRQEEITALNYVSYYLPTETIYGWLSERL